MRDRGRPTAGDPGDVGRGHREYVTEEEAEEIHGGPSTLSDMTMTPVRQGGVVQETADENPERQTCSRAGTKQQEDDEDGDDDDAKGDVEPKREAKRDANQARLRGRLRRYRPYAAR